MPTHYEVLGVPESASEREVRQAYRRLAKATHPDRPDGAPGAERFEQVAEAYRVLSDPDRRAAYDRSLHPGPATPATTARAAAGVPPVRPRYGRAVALLAAVVVVGGAGWLALATARQSVGDGCLVGRWRTEAFEIGYRGVLDGRDVAAPVRGGAGAVLEVGADGVVRTDYVLSAPLTGTDGALRIEVAFRGTTIERWRAAEGQVELGDADTSRLELRSVIGGRPPDRPPAASVLGGRFTYTCTPGTLEIGPYRYVRA